MNCIESRRKGAVCCNEIGAGSSVSPDGFVQVKTKEEADSLSFGTSQIRMPQGEKRKKKGLESATF